MKPFDQEADSPHEHAGEPMDHQTIEHQRIIDRYVMGQLPPNEAERFEEHYFACSTCFEQVELTEALQRGLKHVAVQDANTVVEHLGLLAWIRRQGRALRPAMLLLVVAAMAVPSVFLLQRLENSELELQRARQPQVNPPLLVLNPERSGSPTVDPSHRIRLGKENTWIAISLELAGFEYETYRVTLVDEGGNSVWQDDELRPNQLDALALMIHSSSFSGGDYTFRVESLASVDEHVPVGQFSFRVLASE